MAKKYVIQFQDADPVIKPLFWTGYKYTRSYRHYAELTANLCSARLFMTKSAAKLSLDSFKGIVENHGTFEIVRVEVNA